MGCLLRWVTVTSGLAVLSPIAGAQEAAEGFASGDILRTIVLLGALTILPALFMSMTAFIRIAVVLAMIRHAFGMPETPPNPILVMLSLFLTFFVMTPTFDAVRTTAFTPYVENEMTLEEAVSVGQVPMKEFMLSQVQDKDLLLMYELSGRPAPASPEDVDLFLLVPAFILNELRVAFTIGFVIMLPFLLIDLIISSILLSLGMMMVPPATISLPIKILVFVMIDGWALIIRGVLGGFG
ncbi:flagellar type III secretion system pore protein FliP [Ponticaulis koreensis]|uniref:flagellar type III secretion system pore protein FliP n=1 Tax=Ponticaulis koreensis TaxID=1123045 RepID=UPI0003B6DE28|nr:flagellar type III secretion system pore protein FliP [Ponticaulis koreensis]